jgi:hypothetical protein
LFLISEAKQSMVQPPEIRWSPAPRQEARAASEAADMTDTAFASTEFFVERWIASLRSQ